VSGLAQPEVGERRTEDAGGEEVGLLNFRGVGLDCLNFGASRTGVVEGR
jgi:hypothetical protein